MKTSIFRQNSIKPKQMNWNASTEYTHQSHMSAVACTHTFHRLKPTITQNSQVRIVSFIFQVIQQTKIKQVWIPQLMYTQITYECSTVCTYVSYDNSLQPQSFAKSVSFCRFSKNSSFQGKTKLKSMNPIQNIFTNHNNARQP